MQPLKLMNKAVFQEFFSIPDFTTVVPNTNSLPEWEKPINVRSNTGIIYTGQIGYKILNPEVVAPCLQLKKQESEISHSDLILLVWSVSYRKSAITDEWFLIPSLKAEAITTESKLMVHSGIKVRVGYPNQFLIGNVSVHCKLELTIFEYGIDADPWNDFLSASTTTHKQNWAQCLANAHPSTADLKIICNDGVELWAHQLVLCEQNEVFAAELRHHVMIEGRTGVIELREINSSTMRILLQFFYTGELPADEWKKPENILGITWAAGKYMLGGVLNMLDNNLGLFDHGENTAKLMGLANQLDLKKAEKRLLERVKEIVQRADSVPNVMGLFGASHLLMTE